MVFNRFSFRTAVSTVALCGVLALAGCGSTSEPDEYVERPVEQLYIEAQTAMKAQDYQEAKKQFDEVERQHPYSNWATRAKLMAAFASYQDLKYDDAVVALERFIQLHPGHEDVAYAYYLRALCFYEQISDVKRDQHTTALSMQYLQDVINRFPDSPYARDAKLKMDLTRDHLAGKEMDVGRWYLRQGQVQAAISRFRVVVDEYQTTSHVPEALHRLVEAYLGLGLRGEAERVATVLGHNYPGTNWYTDSYALLVDSSVRTEPTDGFITRAWRSVVE